MTVKIKKLLHIRNIEDFFGYKYIFDILIFGFLFFLSSWYDLQLRLLSHIFTLFWISINTYQLFTIFKRKKCEFIFFESPITDDIKFYLFFISSVLENITFGIFTFLFLIFFMHATIPIAFFITILHFSFAIGLGSFFSQLHDKHLGLLAIIILYMWCFICSSSWTADEFWRYISLTLQLYNVQKINATNTVSLIILTVILILLAKYLMGFYRKYKVLKIIGIISLSICLFIGTVYYELSSNNNIREAETQTIIMDQKTIRWKGINEETVIMLSGMLEDMEEELITLGIESTPIKEYQFNKYYVSYLYFVYKTRPTPIVIENDTIYVDIFSEAMTNFDEDYITRDFVSRYYDQVQNRVTNIENKYVYQIVEGCREHVYKYAFQNSVKKHSDHLVTETNRLIKKRNDSATTKSNFVKKIINLMFEEYKEDIPKLYSYVQSELPETDLEFVKILEKNFPELLEDSNIKKIVESVYRSE